MLNAHWDNNVQTRQTFQNIYDSIKAPKWDNKVHWCYSRHHNVTAWTSYIFLQKLNLKKRQCGWYIWFNNRGWNVVMNYLSNTKIKQVQNKTTHLTSSKAWNNASIAPVVTQAENYIEVVSLIDEDYGLKPRPYSR